MDRSLALSLLCVLFIALVAAATFAMGWKTGCIGTAIAVFKVVQLCVQSDR